MYAFCDMLRIHQLDSEVAVIGFPRSLFRLFLTRENGAVVGVMAVLPQPDIVDRTQAVHRLLARIKNR